MDAVLYKVYIHHEYSDTMVVVKMVAGAGWWRGDDQGYGDSDSMVIVTVTMISARSGYLRIREQE